MQEIGAYEAKTYLPKLLKQVEKGEKIIITRHGTPVAVLSPPPQDLNKKNINQFKEKILKIRKGHKLKGFTIKDLIDDGRSR